MKGLKTGGRKKGTPNGERKELREMLNEKYPNYHPVMAMVEIAHDKKNEINLIFQANKEVAKYVCPQLKSIELTGRAERDNGRKTNQYEKTIFDSRNRCQHSAQFIM